MENRILEKTGKVKKESPVKIKGLPVEKVKIVAETLSSN